MKNIKTIYYADDDEDDIEFFKESVTALGHRAITFLSGHQLVEALSKASQKPDFIFLDVNMPKSMGNSIISEIHDAAPNKRIPIILFTSYDRHAGIIQKILDAGANFVLEKPSSFAEYQSSINMILNMDWKNYRPSKGDSLTA
jgi:CheY-like chemotaxis protein